MSETRIIEYIIAIAIIYMVNYAVYLIFNKGLARNAIKLQGRRYLIASVVSMLPLAISQVPFTSPAVTFNVMLAFFCGTAYPIIFHICNRKKSPDHDHRIDLAYGIYIFGWFTSLRIVFAAIEPVMGNVAAIILCSLAGVMAFAASLLAIVQWGHFFIYSSCIDNAGIQAAQDTDRNEAREFIKSFPVYIIAIIVLAIIIALGGCITGENIALGSKPTIAGAIVAGVWIVAMCKYIWVGKRSLLSRTGLVKTYLDVKEYSQRSMCYVDEMKTRLANLQVSTKNKEEKPHTFIMVIGESVSKEYVSAFSDIEQNTSPWLKECKADEKHNIIFGHAYSCANQTVPTLERVLTERNLYNNKEFHESVSIIDIARKAGYTTHWYSNQGCIGVAETSITLVAKTCDTAKWTEQEVNKVQYDGSLLDFLDEVDPTKNNFVVLHLMGSHFNFINRYPKEATRWGEPGVQDNILNYLNSIHYTDTLLKRIHEYAAEKLNLSAMLYFSDHGCIPDKRRVPQFDGFNFLRIPMSLHCTDSYISRHHERFETFKANKDKYFTNDLMYEFVCSLLDVESNYFDTKNSLGHKEYKYTRDTLLTNNGQTRICEDKE